MVANIFALFSFSQPSQLHGLSGVVGINLFCKKFSVYSQLTRVYRQTDGMSRKCDLNSGEFGQNWFSRFRDVGCRTFAFPVFSA